MEAFLLIAGGVSLYAFLHLRPGAGRKRPADLGRRSVRHRIARIYRNGRGR